MKGIKGKKTISICWSYPVHPVYLAALHPPPAPPIKGGEKNRGRWGDFLPLPSVGEGRGEGLQRKLKK
jgi:hypothetical protein